MSNKVVIVYDIDTGEVIEATKDLEGLDTATKETQQSVNNFDKSVDGMADTVANAADAVNVFGIGLGTVSKNAVGAIRGVKGLTTGFKALDVLLKGSVIFLIVGALATLAINLTKTAKGTEFLRKAFATLQGIGNALLDVFINIDKIFSRNIVDVFEKNIRLAREYAVQLRQNQINARALSAEIARLSSDYEIASQKADDATTSLKAQNEAALQAAKDLEELRRQETALATQRLDELEKEREQALATGQEIQQDLLDRINEAEIAREQALTNETLAFLQSQQRIRQIDQDTFEQRRDFLLDFTDTNKAINERIIADTTRPIEERLAILEKTRQFTDEAFEKSLDLFEKQAGQRLDVNMLLKESDADVVFNYLSGTNLSEIETQRFLELLRERNIEQQDLAEAERDLAKEREERALKEEERRDEELRRELERQDERKRKEEEVSAAIIRTQEELTDARAALAFESADTAIFALNLIGRELQAFSFAALAIEKSLAIADIIINLQKEIAALTANAAANPINILAPGAGFALALPAIGAAKARAALSTGVVLAQTFDQIGAFKDGVIDLRGPGTMTSDDIPAMLSDHESVIKGRATLKYKPALQAINEELVDPDLINGIATGKIDVLDNTKVIEVPRTQLNMDVNGFSQHIVNKANRTIIRRNRYKG